MWHHRDPQLFLLLAGSFAAFLTPSALDELIKKSRARGRAADQTNRPLPWLEPWKSPPTQVDITGEPSARRRTPKYLEKAKPLDGLQRDRPAASRDQKFAPSCGDARGTSTTAA